ncbi:Signal peptide, CUB and EGF-like domain-containing protein 1 [Larimichthys crocea]|uniref:Uncharacterized protein n=1 Tax=Larimichthys crocea TaxID=215358 RepID=A0ACD3QIX1_LARCR|nr:Signal peptide, CUB and EGF-like domain-containing protein 1 [Larimichthys crocea]
MDESQCRSCSPGFYCSETGLSAVSGPCLAGYYCLEGSQTATPMSSASGDVCPAGYYCVEGSHVPTPCPVGSYQNETGGKGTDDCKPCPIGSFQDLSGQRECNPCPPGFHCLSPSHSRPLPCPAGYICPRNSPDSQPLPCPKGTYSPNQGLTNTGECLVCPAGQFCGSEGLVEPSGACAAGFLCLMGATVPNPTDNRTGSLCPPGIFCQQGLRAGDCWTGFYCDWGSSRADEALCPAGFFCPSGTRVPMPCPAGTFSSEMGNTHQDNCTTCTPGYYCQGLILGLEFPCPPGTVQSQLGASSPEACLLCPAGTEKSECFVLSPALSQPTGLCEAGYYCPAGSTSPNSTEYQGNSTKSYLCPSGHYCPSGTGYPLHCPTGSLSISRGLKEDDECPPCPPGLFCDRPAIAELSDALPCNAGYVCLGGSSSPTPSDGSHGYLCPSGHSCPVGSVSEIPCEPGTYNPAPGAARCITCPKGTVCSSTATQEPSICPAGYFCQGGATEPTPQSSDNFPRNGPCPEVYPWRAALHCPAGHYCSTEGLAKPSGPCAAGFYCPFDFSSTTPYAFLCPKGHYCSEGSPLALPCPTGEYQPNPGSDSCIPCRPGFYCEEAIVGDPWPCPTTLILPCRAGRIQGECAAGYLCVSGSADFTPQGPMSNLTQCQWGMQCAGPCPSGFYCPMGTEEAELCPANTFRNSPGGAGLQDCLPCPPQYWCQPGEPALHLCPVGHYCDGLPGSDFGGGTGPRPCPLYTYQPYPGAGSKGDCLPCPPGSHCNTIGLTDYSNSPCPPGFWCSGTGPPILCPAGTMRPLPGATAPSQCELCEGGTYCPDPRDTGQPNLKGIPCRASYQCPIGSDNYKSNSCPLGHVCPTGSTQPIPCPPGTFGNLNNAKTMSDCHPCPAGTFNHLSAQKACFPCGSSSTSLAGSSSCTCIGKNRAFQHSDGSCLCRTGFIFYNELDFKSSASDSELDCQPEANRRCAAGQVRLAASRECVSPSLHSCNITCGQHGGTLDVEMGICQCERYVSAEELCNISCLSRLPQLSAQFAPDGHLLLSLKEKDSMVWARAVMNVLGPDIHAKSIGKTHFVQFDSEGVFGWIPTQRELVQQFLSEPIELINTRPKTRRDKDNDDDTHIAVLPRIPNPVTCLSAGDMLIFQLTINHTGLPMCFQKQGSMCLLTMLSQSGVWWWWSAEDGTECNPRASVFQPMTPTQLVKYGIIKQHRLNLLPDWGLIVGILSLLLVVVVVVTTTVLVLRPGKAKLVSQWRAKPKWRNLGEPFCPVDCVCSGESIAVPSLGGFLGSRGVGEGAEAEEPAISKGGSVSGCCDLEEFNVKTLYDKLEDQNLHIASQLARHRKDTQEFYRNMCQQTETIKNVFENMDNKKLSLLKELLVHNAMRDKPTNSSAEEKDAQAEASIVLLGAVLRSVETLLCRLTGEVWPHDGRECEQQSGYTHPGDSNMYYTQVIQLLANCPLFPSVVLLLAKSIPISSSSSNEALLAHCARDFYFDATNQILYLSEAKLQHVGHFVATILQSMAHIASGSKPQSFVQALHEAISALSLQLFNFSFKWNTAEGQIAFIMLSSHSQKSMLQRGRPGALVDEFLNIRVPTEEHFTEHILASRLEKYKYFKLEQLIANLKRREDMEAGSQPKGTPMQISCVEEEIDRMNESFLQLSVQLQKRAQMITQLKERENSAGNHSVRATPTSTPSLSRNGTILLELKRRHVSQRLNELQITLGQMRRCQQHDSKSKDGTRGYTQTDSSTTQQGQREHYAGVDGCSSADGQRQDSIPASQSHSQQTAESSNRKLESHISDQQRGDTVQINNPDTLPDSQMLNSQDQLHLNVPGKHKLNSQVTIENTAGHTDIDNM